MPEYGVPITELFLENIDDESFKKLTMEQMSLNPFLPRGDMMPIPDIWVNVGNDEEDCLNRHYRWIYFKKVHRPLKRIKKALKEKNVKRARNWIRRNHSNQIKAQITLGKLLGAVPPKTVEGLIYKY